VISPEFGGKMLLNHVVFISGAGGLIGKRLVEVSLASGASVVATDINLAQLDGVANSLGELYPEFSEKLLCLEVDLTSRKSIEDALSAAIASFGKVTDFVNTAYPRNKNYGRDFFDVEYDDFCENISLNIGTVFLSSQIFARYFKKVQGGNIVNFGSIYGVVAPDFDIYPETMTMPVEYAAIKSAVIHLTKYMAQLLRMHNVRVNCISPGGVLDSQPKDFLNSYNSKCGRIGMLSPSHLDSTFLYLMSSESSAVTGQNIVVDDGFTL